MNPHLNSLHAYPFERLAKLLSGISHANPISLTIGEPQHAPAQVAIQALENNLSLISKYPATRGSDELRTAIAHWLNARYHLTHQLIAADSQVLPVTGTREALFSAIQALLPSEGCVASPNPFYQIYEGGTLLAGGKLALINCTAASNFQIDFDAIQPDWWSKIDILIICTPANPQGQCLSSAQLKQCIKLAHQHDFVIFSDECYSEIYPSDSAAPAGLLEASQAINNVGHSRCLVFNSLSKRSNLPGLRSGFVAGCKSLIAAFLKYRTYHGCAMPMHHQKASIAAWSDEEHVIENRQAYDRKYQIVVPILQKHFQIERPDASFYLWLNVKGCDQEFARNLYEATAVKVLPGTFLARESDGSNPGYGYVRIALVDTEEQCSIAANKIADFVATHSNY